MNKSIKKILNFWQLCELINFEELDFDKQKIKSFNQFRFQTEKDSEETIFLGSNPSKAVTNVYKQYHGIIRSEDLVRYIYKCIEETGQIPLDNDIQQDLENDLERVKLDGYTYLAYTYLDHTGKNIAISGKCIVLNPIFYVLKYLTEENQLNNIELYKFTEAINNDLLEKGNYSKISKNIIVPNYDFLKKIAKYNNPLKLLGIETNKILILPTVIEELRKNKNDSEYNKILEAIENKIEEEANIEKVDEHSLIVCSLDDCSSDDFYIDAANNARLSTENQYYIVSEQKFNMLNCPINLSHLTSLNMKSAPTPKLEIIYPISQQSENYIKEIIKIIKEKLQISNDLFTNEYDAPIESFMDIKLNSIASIVEQQMTSFYFDALNEIPSKMTEKYIEGIDRKIDVNKDITTRQSINSVNDFQASQARWPSPYPLYYAQQAAVNLFIKKYNEIPNIFSVNGPPGTGKTTLLKDVIANIITLRIQKCIETEGQIFNNELLNFDLCGNYELFVVSNNNAAVENISLELPKESDFEFEYIGMKKSDLLLEKYFDTFYNGKKSWSLISARLGKSKNVNEFRNAFLSLLDNITNDQDQKISDQVFLKKRYEELKEKFINTQIDIQGCVDEFNKYATLPEFEKEVENLKKQITNNENKIKEYSEELVVGKIKIGDLEQKIESFSIPLEAICAQEESKKLKISNFGFFSKHFFQRKQYRQCNDDLDQILEKKASILLEKVEYNEVLESQKLHIKEIQNKINLFNTKLKAVQEKYLNDKVVLDRLLKEYKTLTYKLSNYDFFARNEPDIQLDTPFKYEIYLILKAKLFFLAMQLTEVLFLQNLELFKKNILYYLDYNRKKSLTTEEEKQLRSGFSALFFLFPVVSSSLASSYKMLKNIKSFGTVLCDESGQATPQSIVGVLNRAKNALIVGDPLQVEPVFTAPTVLVKLLSQIFKIDKLHSPLFSSVQQLADHANSYGSYYKVNNEKVWVGMPLVVHRRCIEPMFSISNIISYNNKMVLATPNLKENDSINNLPNSCWIDVKSEDSDFTEGGNASRAEQKAFDIFYNKYKEYLKDNFYIISPFKTIHKTVTKKYYQKESDENYIGTVHTFQGKEADIVFFLLGGNVKRPGSKGWVSSKANILNVANTRAKKRIYIVGDYNLWKTHNYFKDAIKCLNKIELSKI